jgi:hypothetical protein
MPTPITQTPVTPPHTRVAYTFAEFAELFGRDRSWAYRMAKGRGVRVVRGYGAMMIPASEVDRLLGEATEKPE